MYGGRTRIDVAGSYLVCGENVEGEIGGVIYCICYLSVCGYSMVERIAWCFVVGWDEL